MSSANQNYQKLVDICENDLKLVSAVLATMSETFPLHVTEIDKALSQWNVNNLKERLHLLKGSLSYLSLRNETQKIMTLEQYIEQNAQELFNKAYPPIRSFILDLPSQLQAELNKTHL